MIVYFADRYMTILGSASTELPSGPLIYDDLKTSEIEVGVSSLEFSISYDGETKEEIERWAEVGNYLIRQKDGDDNNEFYTIIDSEDDSKDASIMVYAEDAGLDLLNEIVEPYEADKAYPASYYINKFAYDSGFEVGLNEISDLSRKLKWEGESTATARILSVATQFDNAEISYSFDIKGLSIVKKKINIYKKRGTNTEIELRLDKDIDRIVTKKSVANLATAFRCTGGTPENSETPITLSGYKYDDGDYYVSGNILKCRSALAKWTRYLSETGNDEGHIVQAYSYDTLSQSELCNRAVSALKKVVDMEVNYEVDVAVLPRGVNIGDYVRIIDSRGRLYLSGRVLKLESSDSNNEHKATLGEYLIKSGGIAQSLKDLAAQFGELSKNRIRYTWTAYANDEEGADISLYPDGKVYMGTANNQLTYEPVLTDPSIYKWVKMVRYTWTAYANTSEGVGISLDPDGKAYMGIAANRLEETPDLSNPRAYIWSKIKGEDGNNGLGIDTVTVTYGESASGTIKPTTWSETIPDVPEGKYLWTKTYITYTDGTETTGYSVSYKGRDGEDGQDGVGVKETAVTYQVGTEGTTAPTGTWSANIPSVSANQYLWTRTVITYTNNTTSTSYSVSKQGANGLPGSDGVGITSTEINYAIGDSGEEAPESDWRTVVPAVPNGKYLWTRVVTNYSNNTSSTSYTVSRQPLNGSSGIVVSETAPNNPEAGQLWQTATGEPIKRWNGETWVIHYISIENLDVETLSAISANLGTVRAGLILQQGNSNDFYINVENGQLYTSQVIEPQDPGSEMEWREFVKITNGELECGIDIGDGQDGWSMKIGSYYLRKTSKDGDYTSAVLLPEINHGAYGTYGDIQVQTPNTAFNIVDSIKKADAAANSAQNGVQNLQNRINDFINKVNELNASLSGIMTAKSFNFSPTIIDQQASKFVKLGSFCFISASARTSSNANTLSLYSLPAPDNNGYRCVATDTTGVAYAIEWDSTNNRWNCSRLDGSAITSGTWVRFSFGYVCK